jgi:hypothetical protein
MLGLRGLQRLIRLKGEVEASKFDHDRGASSASGGAR